MDAEKIAKSTQEQATAAWIQYLYRVRIHRLQDLLQQQGEHLEAALSTLDDTWETIKNDIINKGAGRGGANGMHGFIAEVAECGISNARHQLEHGGLGPNIWIDDNGPADIAREGILIQQKFCEAGGNLSLAAIKKHLETYPDFLGNGNKYQIPRDHYDKVVELLKMPEDQANKLPTDTGEFSLRQWRMVHRFFDEGSVTLEDIEPSELSYPSVQRDTIEIAIEDTRAELQNQSDAETTKIKVENKATVQEGAKTTAVSAAIEAVTTLILAIQRKRKEGKKLAEFTTEDWENIAKESGIGAVKGGIRGAGVYVLTNSGLTNAAVASAMFTAMFGVADQISQYHNSQLDENQLLENAESVCMDAAVSAVFSTLGQAAIPVPILGAIIGNAVGTLLFQTGKDVLSEQDAMLLQKYATDLKEYQEQHLSEYAELLNRLDQQLTAYMLLLDEAYAPDIAKALEGASRLARMLGVSEENNLDTDAKFEAFFFG